MRARLPVRRNESSLRWGDASTRPVGPASADGGGSVLLLVLFACLTVAVVVNALVAVVLCAERALGDERVGRALMAQKDMGLATLRQRSAIAWQESSWTTVLEDPHPVEGSLEAAGDEADPVMQAHVRHEGSVSILTVSAWVERGCDGLDLPLAAAVAGSLVADGGRSSVWLEAEYGAGEETAAAGAVPGRGARAYVHDMAAAPLLGEGCSVAFLEAPWRLDPGWSVLTEGMAQEGVTSSEDTVVLAGRRGSTVRLLPGESGRSLDVATLVVVVGGADLDATGLGELYGVLVVDDGSVSLEGTTLHGAVFATRRVDLGETGRICFLEAALRKATDRSVVRTRLVPGSRREGTE